MTQFENQSQNPEQSLTSSLIMSVNDIGIPNIESNNQLKNKVWQKIVNIFDYLSLFETIWVGGNFDENIENLSNKISEVNNLTDSLSKRNSLSELSKYLESYKNHLSSKLSTNFEDIISNDYMKIDDKLSMYVDYVKLHNGWNEFVSFFNVLMIQYQGIYLNMLDDNWSDSVWITLIWQVDTVMKLLVDWKINEARSLVVKLSWKDIQVLSNDKEFKKDQIVAKTGESLVNEQYGIDWSPLLLTPNPEIKKSRENISSLLWNLKSNSSIGEQKVILLEYKNWLSWSLKTTKLDPLVFDEMIGLTKETKLKQYLINNKNDILESFNKLEGVYENLENTLEGLEKLPTTDYNNKNYAEVLALMTIIEWLSNDPTGFLELMLYTVWFEDAYDTYKVNLPALIVWEFTELVWWEKEWFIVWSWLMTLAQAWFIWYSAYGRYGWMNTEEVRDKKIEKIKNKNLSPEEQEKRIWEINKKYELEKSTDVKLKPLIDFYTDVAWDKSMIKKLHSLTELHFLKMTFQKNYPFEKLFARDVLKILSDQEGGVISKNLKRIFTLSVWDNINNVAWSSVDLSNIDNFLTQWISEDDKAIGQLEQVTKKMQTINEVVSGLKDDIDNDKSWLNRTALKKKIDKKIKEILNPNFVRSSSIVDELEKVYGEPDKSWVNKFSKDIKEKLLKQIELVLSTPRNHELKISNEIENILNEKPKGWKWKIESLGTSFNQIIWKRVCAAVDFVSKGKISVKVNQHELMVNAIEKANIQIEKTNKALKWSTDNLKPYLIAELNQNIDKFDGSIRSNNKKISDNIKNWFNVLDDIWEEKLSWLADEAESVKMKNIISALNSISEASESIKDTNFDAKIKWEIELILKKVYKDIHESIHNEKSLEIDERLGELTGKDWEITKIRNNIIKELPSIKNDVLKKRIIDVVRDWVREFEPDAIFDKITIVSTEIQDLKSISQNFDKLDKKIQTRILISIWQDSTETIELAKKVKILQSVANKDWLFPSVEKEVLNGVKTKTEIEKFVTDITELRWKILAYPGLEEHFNKAVTEFDASNIETLKMMMKVIDDGKIEAKEIKLAEIKAGWWSNSGSTIKVEVSDWKAQVNNTPEKVDTTNDASPEKSEIQSKLDRLQELKNSRKELSRLTVSKAPIVSIWIKDANNEKIKISFDLTAKNASIVLKHLESVHSVSSVTKLLKLKGVSDVTSETNTITAKEKLILENHKQKELAIDFIERAKLELQLANVDDVNWALDKIKLEFVDKPFSDDKAIDLWKVKTLIGEYLHTEWIKHIREKEELLRDFGKNIPNLTEQEFDKYAKMYAEWRYDSMKESARWRTFYDHFKKAAK